MILVPELLRDNVSDLCCVALSSLCLRGTSLYRMLELSSVVCSCNTCWSLEQPVTSAEDDEDFLLTVLVASWASISAFLVGFSCNCKVCKSIVIFPLQIHWALCHLSVASSGICVWSKSSCAVLLWDSVPIVSTIVSSSYIANFHSRTFVFEKTFSLGLAGKLRNITHVAYSYRNGVLMTWAACLFVCIQRATFWV